MIYIAYSKAYTLKKKSPYNPNLKKYLYSKSSLKICTIISNKKSINLARRIINIELRTLNYEKRENFYVSKQFMNAAKEN